MEGWRVKHKIFDTSIWDNWPQELAPIHGCFVDPSVRPEDATSVDGLLNLGTARGYESNIIFERVLFDRKKFINSIIELEFEKEASEGTISLNANLLRIYGLIEEHLLGQKIETARKFSYRKLKMLGLYSSKQFKDQNSTIPDQLKIWNTLSVEEIWFQVLPIEISNTFVIKQDVNEFTPEEQETYEDIIKILTPYLYNVDGYNPKFSSIQKTFIRHLKSGKIDSDLAISLAAKGFAIIHDEYNKSVEHLLKSLEFDRISQLLTNSDATREYIKLWHTSKGPWSSILQRIVPAVNNAIPSIYKTLNYNQKELFDEYVFFKKSPPPKEILLQLLLWTHLHSLTLEKIRELEKSAKRNNRHSKNLPTKDACFKQVTMTELTTKQLGLDTK